MFTVKYICYIVLGLCTEYHNTIHKQFKVNIVHTVVDIYTEENNNFFISKVEILQSDDDAVHW
jgi:hypothetical protein